MMKTGSELLGKPIITADDGRRLGVVRDLLFDDSFSRVIGLVLVRRLLFGRSRVIGFSDIDAIGNDAIVTRPAAAPLQGEQAAEVTRGTSERSGVQGKPMVSLDGRYLGALDDVVFDETTGRIVGYEITTRGRLGLRSQHNFLPAQEATVGTDVLVVPSGAQVQQRKDADLH